MQNNKQKANNNNNKREIYHKEEVAISTAISDFFLASFTFYFAYLIFENGRDDAKVFEFYAFLIIAIAASFGTLRFGLLPNSKLLLKFHQFFSALGSQSVSLLSLCLWTFRDGQENREFRLIVVSCILFAIVLLSFISGSTLADIIEPLDVVVGGLTLMAAMFKATWILWPSELASNILYGGLCYFSAGLLIGTKGHLFGIPRVDIFHYLLIVANYFYATSVLLLS